MFNQQKFKQQILKTPFLSTTKIVSYFTDAAGKTTGIGSPDFLTS